MTSRWLILVLVVTLAAGLAVAGEPDWFTRVKEKGLKAASEVEVARHEKGILSDSLHVGECYYNLRRFEDGLAVFKKLLRSSDENYSAAAMVRVGEGQYHLGRMEEAKATFASCLERHPDAWLDGSIAERCRAWLAKLAGKLDSPEARQTEASADRKAIEAAKKEIKALQARLEELKLLLQKLLDD